MDALKEKFATQFVKSYSFLGQNQIEVKKALIAEIMTFMRDNPILPCNYLADETAVHWPKDEEFEIVYILYSFSKNEYVRVKTRIKEWETIESVASVWTTADWLEREVYDMFGVRYANHPESEADSASGGLGRISAAQGLQHPAAGRGMGAQASRH